MRALRQFLGAFSSVAIIFLLSGCDGEATRIRYEQKLNFNVFDPDPASPGSTYGGGYALYKVTEIDNSDREDAFAFEVIDLYGDTKQDSGWNLSWQHHVLGVSWRATDQTLAAGATLTDLGCIVITTGSYIGDALQPLYYNSSGNESVLVVREGGGDPPAPSTAGTVYPQTLAQACQS